MSLDARFQKPFTLPAGLRSFTFSSLVQRAQEQKEALAQSSNGVAAVGGSAVVQGATRFLMVSNLTYATGHAEVVYLLLQRDADPNVIVRWEHTSALRTDFVCELSTVEAATKACHHVNSFGRFERRPKTKYLASYNFVSYNGDSAQPQGEDGAAPSASPPSAPWETYSRGVATALGGTNSNPRFRLCEFLFRIRLSGFVHEEPISIFSSMAVSKLFPEFYEGFSMTQSTSLLSRFPSVMSSPSSFSFPFATKSLAFQIFRHFRCRELLRVHSRLLIILSLPFIYFFLSNPRRSVVFKLFVLLFFSIAVLVFLNLAVPRLPSPIRLFLVRSSPISTFSSSAATKAVSNVRWSIGSKPKSEKRLMSGSWVRVYSNGDVYEGEFHKGRCSGSGVYHYHMSGRYEGDWIDEKYDGYGVETWAKGRRYRGQYRQGLRNGIGIYRFYTGDVYAGEWSNGQCHGCGVHTCQDGSRYVGEFKWGVKHGLGHYHFRNGDTYAGEYFADKMHGFGVYWFGNGHLYEGAWHEGNRQGLGVYTFRNGETQSGHWQNGVLDVPSLETSHPGSSYAVSHAKVLAAVQEARRAAEKAFDAGRVDERVNKAVTAANKAANAARVAAVKAVQKQMDQETSTNPPILLV